MTTLYPLNNAIKIITRLLFSVALTLSTNACGPGKERIIREKVAERVGDFRKKEALKCREILLADAGKTVDSLLLYEALQEVNDSLKQRHPFKPLRPVAIPPIDSAGVKPIFDQ